MLGDEYGLLAAVRSPWGAAALPFWGFLFCGLVPLLPFVAWLSQPSWVACLASGGVVALIGALKSQWSLHPWWCSSLETITVGGGAAAIA